MSHTISLSLSPDSASFGREGKEAGFREGVELYSSDNVFVLLFP